jgi:hypothetical protein
LDITANALRIYRCHDDHSLVDCRCPLNFNSDSFHIDPARSFALTGLNETYTLSEACKQEDWPDFSAAMEKELK